MNKEQFEREMDEIIPDPAMAYWVKKLAPKMWSLLISEYDYDSKHPQAFLPAASISALLFIATTAGPSVGAGDIRRMVCEQMEAALRLRDETESVISIAHGFGRKDLVDAINGDLARGLQNVATVLEEVLEKVSK